MELFKALQTRSESFDDPFKHWEIDGPLTSDAIQEICNADILDPRKDNLKYDGTRALDGGEGIFREGIKSGGKAKKYRCYVTKENVDKFPNLKKFIDELTSKEVYRYMGNLIGKDLSKSYDDLRYAKEIAFVGDLRCAGLARDGYSIGEQARGSTDSNV